MSHDRSKPVNATAGCFLCLVLLLLFAANVGAEEASEKDRLYALNICGGRMTTNSMDDFVDRLDGIDFERSYLLSVGLARTMGRYQDWASWEVEAQVVRHFEEQSHWEFNAMVAGRWEAFCWDDAVDTSVAVAIGPSYATEKPAIEIKDDGETSRFQVYMYVELELALPEYPRVAFITRIHHRSNAWGTVADDGSSNALAVGLKYAF